MPDFADIKSLLDVLHDPLAVALRARWKSFNPFRVLKAEKRELKHTTTLAWLLDPRENHGLGDHFLRSFLKNVCEAAGDHTTLLRYETDNDAIVRVHSELQMRKIKGNRIMPNFDSDAEFDGSANATERDKRRIDVLVEGQGWAVAVEAKIGAGEGDEQLNDYRRTIHGWAEVTGRKLLLVYLTIDEQELERVGWINAQWSTAVAQPLRTVLDASGASAQLGDQQHAFLASYLDILSEIADDENGIVKRHLSELATRHAGALRRLKEVIRTSSGQNAEQNANWIVLYERNKPLLDRLLQDVDLGYELRARMIHEAITSQGFLSVKDDNSYLRFIVADWAERFPKIVEPSDPRLPRVLYEIRNDSKTPQRVFVALQVWHLHEDKYKHEIYREHRVAMVREMQNPQSAVDFPRLFSKNVAKPQLNDKVQSLVSMPIACNIEALDIRHFADELNRFVAKTSKEIEPFLGRFRG
ncbi:PD-(D/E)XK nuclease family protein [Caballeronia novacaledonica]|uniref:PD-(D/E)XK nuclease family protein n=1 Tax=Caballeronia novacaledonica TaxID=1544861 RepID=UPI001EE2C218|nr:PD-(D/E)XK nuclease family protein [Caballeronia novacaledonica]GJH13620.1 PD-(D/E)XK nuclease family protein [Caballeronia novacaledonica]